MSKREYSGVPIDASWQTPPWQNDGETLDAYDSEGDGNIMTVDWPENATDPAEMSNKQKNIILTAARYPAVNDSKKLYELAGLDGSPWYVNMVLKSHWNERYWVDPSVSKDGVKEDVEKIRRQLLDGATTREIADAYPVNHHIISDIAHGVLVDLPESDIPPLEYRKMKPRGWIVPDQFYDKNENMDQDDGGEAGTIESVDTLRKRALDGEAATQIADSNGVTDRTVRKRLIGEIAGETWSDYPPLDYDANNRRWYIPDDTAEEPTTTDTPPKSDAPTTPTPDPARDGTPAWVWAALVAVTAWIVSKMAAGD